MNGIFPVKKEEGFFSLVNFIHVHLGGTDRKRSSDCSYTDQRSYFIGFIPADINGSNYKICCLLKLKYKGRLKIPVNKPTRTLCVYGNNVSSKIGMIELLA